MPLTDGKIVYKAIKETILQYFGKTSEKARTLRKAHIENIYDSENDKFIYQSIKQQKGTGTAICTEQSSVAHNLWLLAGASSYYIYSSDCKMENIGEEYVNDAHCFCIVEYDGKFRLFDTSLNSFYLFEENPIEQIKSGKPIVIDSADGKKIYSGAKQLLSEKKA